jgi:hypothetical protein
MVGKRRHSAAIHEAVAVIGRKFGLAATHVTVLFDGPRAVHESAAFLAENSDVQLQIDAFEKIEPR